MNYLISHVDLDGYGVNVLHALYSDVLNYDHIINTNYGFETDPNILELIKPDNDITIVDLSLPEPIYLEWSKTLKSLRIIDHHETSSYLEKYPGNVWSIDYCGTALFWINVVKNRLVSCNRRWSRKVDYFVALVDTYDRWIDTSEYWEDATRLNKVCVSMGPDKFIEHMVKKINTDWEWTFEEYKCFKEVEESENLYLLECEKNLKIRVDNEGYKFVFIEIPDKSKLSMVCSKLMIKHPSIDYCICYGGGRTSFSLRTRKEMNLTRIHGVNGHKKAAGAKFKRPEFYKLLMEEGVLGWVKEGQRKSTQIVVEDYNGGLIK